MTAPPLIPRVLRAGDGDVTAPPGLLDRYLLESAGSGGLCALVEHVRDPRVLAAPLHRHSREDEYSFVLAGTLGLVQDGVEITATAGDLAAALPPPRRRGILSAIGDEMFRVQKGAVMRESPIAVAIGGARAYLSEHPDEARYRDSEAVAVIEDALAVRVDGDGWSLKTDMARGVGGSASAASPGWLMRAALASCVASLIAMRAAERGVAVRGLQVSVDSESDDRGILGIADDVPAGPFSMRLRVTVEVGDEDESLLREVIEWGFDHCPVCDAIQRSVPVEHSVDLR